MKKIFLGTALIAGTFAFAQSTSTSTEATTPSIFTQNQIRFEGGIKCFQPF